MSPGVTFWVAPPVDERVGKLSNPNDIIVKSALYNRQI